MTRQFPSGRSLPLTERAQRILNQHLKYRVYHPALAQVPVEAARFMDAVLAEERPRWFSLLGPNGCGKTFTNKQICKLLAKWWRVPKYNGRHIPWIAHIQPAADLNDFKAAREYADADLVFIEDICAGDVSEKGASAVVRSRVAELLQLRSGKWTIFDANLYRGQIADMLDPRIASRMRRDDSVCIEIQANVPDFSDTPKQQN